MVVDDVTAIRSIDDAEPQWREIEVELGPGADPSILDSVEELLVAEGITRSPSPSKVHRYSAISSRHPDTFAVPRAICATISPMNDRHC